MPNDQTLRLTLVSMSGLRVGHDALAAMGMSLPGLQKRAAALQALPPLGLLTIAALVPENWACELITDSGIDSPAQVAQAILETSPDLVAFSTLTAAADRAYEISRHIRDCRVPTVVGGLHATAIPEECQEHFDAVVSGDGEESFVALLNDFRRSRLKPVYFAARPFDLAQSPLPRWELLGAQPLPRHTLQTQRGCPWACSFCAASRLLGPPRAKPLDRIRDELALITRRTPRPWLELADDNTFAMSRDPLPLLELLRAFGCRWFSESDWRIADHPGLLQQIALSGCRQLLIGMESSVFQYPGMGRKQAEFQRLIDAIETIQSAGIVVNGCFIVGADGETEESIERLGDFLAQAPFGELQITLQTPFPGTPLYKQLRSQQRLLSHQWSNHTLFSVTYQPQNMTIDQLQTGFFRLIERTFNASSQSRRDSIVKNIRRQQWLMQKQ
jgi:radical SAM superfamily enzyme YgiQ (UPF0313 family)